MDELRKRKLYVYQKIEYESDIINRRNDMAKSNYPLSMTDCEVIGINGDCGTDCPIFQDEICNKALEVKGD